MQITGEGIRKGSNIYFYTPSANAKQNLYYPIAAGDFYCDEKYNVERVSYDSFLALYVCEGTIYFEQGDTKIEAGKDDLILIDCYEPHRYYALDKAHTIWVHFDGLDVRGWYENITSQKGRIIKFNFNKATYIINIMNAFEQFSEYDYSRELYSLLCEIIKPDDSNKESEKYNQIEKAKEFINAHFSEVITVEDIASSVNLSASYFSKNFKDATCFSPYDYLLNIRLEKAKEMLCQTNMSVNEIAYKTGFNSSANFIYFFKKEMGLSPLKFKNLKF